jgi:hypothetical protein
MADSAQKADFTNLWKLNGNRWVQLVLRLMHVQLSDDEDVFWWNLTPSGLFIVKSMYIDLLTGHIVYLKNYIWKINVPFKIRIFMWFLHCKVNLTKDNLIERDWKGCSKCFCFCDQDEITQHLFLHVLSQEFLRELFLWISIFHCWLILQKNSGIG